MGGRGRAERAIEQLLASQLIKEVSGTTSLAGGPTRAMPVMAGSSTAEPLPHLGLRVTAYPFKIERTNHDLVRAIHEVAASDTPTSRIAMYKALLASQLLVPLRNKDPEAIQKKEPIQPVVLRLGEGPALPAFTGWNAVERWPDRAAPATFVTHQAQGVFVPARAINAAIVLINPSVPVGIPIEFQA